MKYAIIEYKVIYWNGNEEIFYAADHYGITHVYSLAVTYANSKAWDSRVKYISDETNGITYKDIKLTYTMDKP